MKTKRIGILSGLLILTLILMANTHASASDTTPPQLSISYHSGNIGNSKALIHGTAYDENGVQKVTVNGEEAKGNWSSVHFFWLKEVYLAEGENIITVVSYDNSTNHNSYSEKVTLNYNPDLYQGPTVKIIPVETLPSNNATLRCVVNPNGYSTSVRLWYGEKEYSFSPFNHGSGDLGPLLTGTDEISLNYTLEREDEPNVGDQFLYVFIVENSRGFSYSEIGNVHITEQIELSPEPDNTSPVLEISSFCGWSEFNVPNSSIIIHGSAYDENGILKVEINGEETHGDINGNWNFWQMKLNLTEGTNHIVVKAYDNSENHNWIENSVNITYQKENYLGPTISLIPIEYISIKEPTIKCIINPNGIDYTYTKLWYSDSSYENAPFGRGRALGFMYNGTENILINYHLGVDHSIQVGDLITYMFRVTNQEGLAQTHIATVSVIDPDITPPSPPPIIPPQPPLLSAGARSGYDYTWFEPGHYLHYTETYDIEVKDFEVVYQETVVDGIFMTFNFLDRKHHDSSILGGSQEDIIILKSGYPSRNEFNLWFLITLPKSFTDGDTWKHNDIGCRVDYIGDWIVKGKSFSDVIKITINSLNSSDEYFRGEGEAYLAKDIGIIDWEFTKANGELFSIEIEDWGELPPRIISGRLTLDGNYAATGYHIGLSNRHENDATSKITDENGRFSFIAYGHKLTLRYASILTGGGLNWDEPTEYELVDIDSDITDLVLSLGYPPLPEEYASAEPEAEPSLWDNIPGFPFQSILSGIIVALLILFIYRKR